MWTYPEEYDVIVVGAGHAGCEAAHASARMGAKTMLLTMTLDTIAKMSCNPAVGGTAKGHIVREIDALGGVMGKVTDANGIQFRMLNASKGPAVWSPRAQADKFAYAADDEAPTRTNSESLNQTGHDRIADRGKRCDLRSRRLWKGLITAEKTVILSSGTFMRGLIHIGADAICRRKSGRQAVGRSIGQSGSLGFQLGRLKTGTPPRINRRSVDFSKMERAAREMTASVFPTMSLKSGCRKSLATSLTPLKRRKKSSATICTVAHVLRTNQRHRPSILSFDRR